MIWLFALIGVITVAVLLWRAFGPGSRPEPPHVIAPDDDPDFLRDLDQRDPRNPLDP